MPGLSLSIEGCGVMDFLSAYMVLFYDFHWYFKNIKIKLKCTFSEGSFTVWHCDVLF